MNVELKKTPWDAAHDGPGPATVESVRLELERCQHEIAECHRRMAELEQAETLLAGENRLLQMVARGCALTEILSALCRLIEELSSGSLCGILLVDPANNRVEHGAAPSLPPGYNEAIHGRSITPSAGPCGMAACLKEQVVAADIAADMRWQSEWRMLALSHGLRACWSTPILSSDGSVLGTFAIYWREPGSPTARHQRIIEQTTHLAAVTIERRRTEAALQQVCRSLRQSEARLEEAQRITHVGYWERDLDTNLITWSNETYRIFGLLPQQRLLHLSQLPELIHPEDRPIMLQAVEEALRGSRRYNVEYRLIRPGGEVRFVHSMGDLVKDESGRPRRMFGTVQDITERKQAAEALRASEHLARGQLAALTRTLDSFALESDPDKLLEHVLRTIVEQSGAQSVSAWDRNAEGGWLDLIAVIEDGQFQTPQDAVHPAARIPVLAQNHPVWREVLRTGQHGVLEQIDQVSARMRVGSEPDAIWHRVLEDTDPDPAMALLKAHLRRLGVRSILFVPMLIAGTVAGIIGIRFQQERTFRREEIELTRALAHQAMLAIELMRLSRQSRQVAVTAERNRLARDIHDTLAQGFTGVIVQLEAAADAQSQGLADEANEHLHRAGDLARESLREARRSVRALRPQALEGKDLCAALDEMIRKMTTGTSLRAEFVRQGEPAPLPTEWDDNLLRIAQEVLTNALRHAHAGEFKAKLLFDPNDVRLELRDNGRGFDPEIRHDGFGLLGIRERVEGMGGQLSMHSAPGKGTEILIVLPLAKAA